MQIQYVSQYLALAERGLVKEISCPLDAGLLMSNQDLEEKIYLYCLSCEYKKYIGIELYNQMVKEIENRN
jgi:hypothetical protein